MSDNLFRGKKHNAHPGWKKSVQAKRHALAEEQNLPRKSRNAAQQIEELDRRLGVGVGAKKERARLASA